MTVGLGRFADFIAQSARVSQGFMSMRQQARRNLRGTRSDTGAGLSKVQNRRIPGPPSAEA